MPQTPGEAFLTHRKLKGIVRKNERQKMQSGCTTAGRQHGCACSSGKIKRSGREIPRNTGMAYPWISLFTHVKKAGLKRNGTVYYPSLTQKKMKFVLHGWNIIFNMWRKAAIFALALQRIRKAQSRPRKYKNNQVVLERREIMIE